MSTERRDRSRASLATGGPLVVRRRRDGGAIAAREGEQPVTSTGPGADEEIVARLGTLGQVYVTLAAARRYAEQCGLRAEEARRELTALLVEGRVLGREGDRLRVRYRTRTTALDITAQVVHEPPLFVVVAAQARHHEPYARRR